MVQRGDSGAKDLEALSLMGICFPLFLSQQQQQTLLMPYTATIELQAPSAAYTDRASWV